MRRFASAVAVAALAITPAVVVHSPADAVVAKWKNCTTVNKRLPHGVGRYGARDHTSGTPVKNFRKSTSLYNEAMRANRGLDRDHDGIACEKR